MVMLLMAMVMVLAVRRWMTLLKTGRPATDPHGDTVLAVVPD
ncbi:hypothetical protein [Desulfolutivibrio sp.]